MESYGKALQSEPGNPEALASIARLHLRQGNQKQAIEYFQQALLKAKTPDDAKLYNELGLALNSAGDYPQAVAALEKSLELAPGTSKYANSLASVRFGGGDASAAYQVLLANNKPAIANYNMAYLLYNGQAAGARGFLNQALQSQQEGADAAVKLAVDRSRSLLAQIDATLGPVAQPAPQATIAPRSSGSADIRDTCCNSQPCNTTCTASWGVECCRRFAVTSTAPVASPASAPANAADFHCLSCLVDQAQSESGSRR